MAEAVTIRAALLPAVGTRLRVVDLELDPPGPGEVRVRLHASGVCSDDLNAFDGSIEVPCPAVLGHEGAGVVEEVGEGVAALRSATTSRSRGRPTAATASSACATCPTCAGRPGRRCWPAGCSTARRACGSAARRCTTTASSRRSPSGPWCRSARACASRRTCPFDVAALRRLRSRERRMRRVADGRRAPGRAGGGVRPGRHRARGGGRLGRGGGRRRSWPSTPGSAGSSGRASWAPTATVRWEGTPADVAAAVREASGGGVDYAFEARGRPAAARGRVPVDAGARRRGAVRHPPRGRDDHAARRSRSRAWSGGCWARSTARPGPTATSR